MRRLFVLVLVPFIISACGGGSSPTTPTPAAVQCTAIALSSTAISQSAGGGATSITVTATPANCTWTAVSNNAFLRVTSQATNTGNGSFTFTTDPNTLNDSRNGSITVGTGTVAVSQLGVAQPLVFNPPAPPATVTVGVPFTHNFAVATGGVAPITYSLDSGGFAPNGLILSPAGILSGTPTAPTIAPLTFGVCAVDGAGNRRCVQFTMRAVAGPLGSWRGNIILQVGCTQPLPQNYPWSGTIRTAANGGTELLVSVPTALVFNEVHPIAIAGQRVTFSIDFGVILNFVGDLSADSSSITGTFTGTNCQIPPVVVIPSGTWNGTKQ